MKHFSFNNIDLEVATRHMKALADAHHGKMSPDQASVCIGVLLSAFNLDADDALEVLVRANLVRKAIHGHPSILVASNE